MQSNDIKSNILLFTFLNLVFILFMIILSPYLLWCSFFFKQKKKIKPLTASPVISAIDKHPVLYEFSIILWNFPIFKKIYKYIVLKGKTLQVGCGTGLMNKYFQNLHIDNLDINNEYLEYGKRHGRFSSYLETSIYKTLIKDNIYDTIVFSRSFHHLMKPGKALVECCRILKPQGYIIIFDPVSTKKKSFEAHIVNSFLDGMICVYHYDRVKEDIISILPNDLYIEDISFAKLPTLTNYNFIYPHTDVIIKLKKV